MQHFKHMNTRDKNSRYSGTIVTYDDSPMYVSEITGENVTGTMLATGRTVEVPFKDLNTKPIRFGYVNGFGKDIYMMRKPARYYKQGFCNTNIVFRGSEGGRGVRDLNLLNDNFFMSKVAEMIQGKYPKYDQAVKDVTNSRKLPSCAFSREFCLLNTKKSPRDTKSTTLLLWRNKTVGKIVKGQPELYDDYGYLSEHLKEVIGS